MKVFAHLRSPGKKDWSNTVHDFERLPVVGEFVILANGEQWYEVQCVVHCPNGDGPKAEFFAVRVDHVEVLARLPN